MQREPERGGSYSGFLEAKIETAKKFAESLKNCQNQIGKRVGNSLSRLATRPGYTEARASVMEMVHGYERRQSNHSDWKAAWVLIFSKKFDPDPVLEEMMEDIRWIYNCEQLGLQ